MPVSSIGWREVHWAEQMLCFLLSGPLLDGELENRLLEAEGKKIPGAAARRAAYERLLADEARSNLDARKQVLLFSLVRDLQDSAYKLYEIRSMRLRAVRFVSRIAVVAIALISLPLLIYFAHFSVDYFVATDRSPFGKLIGSFPNYGLFTALSFGLLGALFSRFLVLQRSEGTVPLDEAATYYGRNYITLRVLVGTVGAIIVYFFLASDLVGGDLAPNIRQLTYVPASSAPPPAHTYLGTVANMAMVPSKDMALLIVWAFLAGFSEQLVPNLLDSTSGRANGQVNGKVPDGAAEAVPRGA